MSFPPYLSPLSLRAVSTASSFLEPLPDFIKGLTETLPPSASLTGRKYCDFQGRVSFLRPRSWESWVTAPLLALGA